MNIRVHVKPERIARNLFLAGVLLLCVCGLLNKVPQFFGAETYAVASGSMAPAIPKGSLIIVDTKQRNPIPGAVMTYRIGEEGNGMTVTHRVSEIQKDGTLIMKGDANESEDPAGVKPDALIGTVVRTIPYLGILLKAGGIGSPAVVITLASGLLWILLESHSLQKGENESCYEKP